MTPCLAFQKVMIPALAMAATLMTLPATAADLATSPLSHSTPQFAAATRDAAPWNVQISLYGWATALDGEIGLRNLPTTAVHMPFSDVLGKLDGALMATTIAHNGTWLLLADAVFARLSDARFGNVLGGSMVGVGLNETILSGAVGLMLPTGRADLDVAFTAGLRYVNLRGTMSIAPVRLPLGLAASQNQNWIDPTIGLFAHWVPRDNWFVTIIADIGGFTAGSQLSSTGYVGLGYMWTAHVSTSLGYRYLYEDYEGPGARTGTFRYNAMTHGPTMALSFHF